MCIPNLLKAILYLLVIVGRYSQLSYLLQAFNNTRHDYEIQLESGSVIKQCEDDGLENIPQVLYHVGIIVTLKVTTTPVLAHASPVHVAMRACLAHPFVLGVASCFETIAAMLCNSVHIMSACVVTLCSVVTLCRVATLCHEYLYTAFEIRQHVRDSPSMSSPLVCKQHIWLRGRQVHLVRMWYLCLRLMW